MTRRLNHQARRCCAERRSGPRPCWRSGDSRRRGILALAAALGLVIAAAVVAAVRESSGRSSVPVQLTGESVAVIDPGTNTIVGEIPVGGRPAGLAVGEGSVWVGNRDDNTILRIDPRSLDVVRRIGLSVAPTDVDVGAGSVWVLSDWALLRVHPATYDVVDTIPLPRSSAGALVPYGGRRERGLSSAAAPAPLEPSSASTLPRCPSRPYAVVRSG